ncbi:MAG TPA: sialate O-acetylesterase, partial [Chitinophagaceae bacterium]|nr:sialate O-acetylesterase [Chitinophagaceae bacterium]
MRSKKNNIIRLRFFLLAPALFFVNALYANVRMPAIFSDGMVLQRQTKCAVWGWAEPGEQITIEPGWSGKIVSAKADASGKWTAWLQTPKAGGPYTIKIQGNNSIELKDVLIGEVWVCSGQSNMVFALKGDHNAKTEIPAADFPSIRYFSVERQYRPEEFSDGPGSVWKRTSPATAGSFSAVAYYFAKKIHQQLNVPVGIVYAAWGGTPAEAWTPAPVIKNDTVLSKYIDRWQTILGKVGEDSVAYHLAVAEWRKDSTRSKRPEEPQTFYYYKRPWREPSVLFNGMISPVIPYGIKGVLWYQGESNVGYPDEYYHLFSRMINGWRDKWNANDLPFYFVQIAPFGYSNMDAAARVRDAQYQVMQNIPATGMAVTLDIGNMKDQHPTKKQEVGDRLALIALAKDYGLKTTIYKGPEFKKVYVQNEKVAIEYGFSGSPLVINGTELKGFEIGYRLPGNDTLVFVNASAKLEGNKVIAWNEKVGQPLGV